jgi:hypothetical protein
MSSHLLDGWPQLTSVSHARNCLGLMKWLREHPERRIKLAEKTGLPVLSDEQIAAREAAAEGVIVEARHPTGPRS